VARKRGARCATRTTGGYCVEESASRTGLERESRGCDEDGESEGTNKTDEIAHWCFDMGQIMFDTGDPCLVWLIARYMCVYAFFRRFDTRRRGMTPRRG